MIGMGVIEHRMLWKERRQNQLVSKLQDSEHHDLNMRQNWFSAIQQLRRHRSCRLYSLRASHQRHQIRIKIRSMESRHLMVLVATQTVYR
jgi:hypothetical protein